MRLIPMSASELAWDLFYENGEALGHYRKWVAPGIEAVISQIWCRVDITWERAGRNTRVARLDRELPRGGVAMRDCTHLRFFGAVCPGGVIRLVVNGHASELAGTGHSEQYTVPVHGGRIRSLSFEVIARKPGAGAASLIWTALVSMPADKHRLTQRGSWDSSWDGLIVPSDRDIRPCASLGLLFDDDDIAGLRRKAGTAIYRPFMQRLRRSSRGLLKTEPERLIGRFACGPLHYTRPPERHALVSLGGYNQPWDNFDQLALTGLLDGDRRILRHAARWMLSVASCDFWYNDFAGELPGTRFHHRSFTEANLSLQMALALDWAGGALTDEGRAVVRDAIARRGLPRMQQDFLEQEYIRSMNQGIVFSTGRIMGTLALCKAWPRAETLLRDIRDDIMEMYGKTFDRDGGSVEGPGYWLSTLNQGLTGIIALARHDGCEPAALLPAKMRAAAAYPGIFESTAAPGDSLPIADSRGYPLCTPALASMLTRVFPGADADRLAAHSLRRHDPRLDSAAFTLIFGPDRLRTVAPLMPPFALRRRAGHVRICRQMRGVGPVRLQFYGAPGTGGSHSHEDRGNILIEAGGESVFVDRGIGDYSNPATFAKRAYAHNLLVPATPDGTVPVQNIGHTVDILPSAAYRNGIFRASMNTTTAWPAHVKACSRRIVSPEPGLFVFTDKLETTKPLAAVMHLHTPLKLVSRNAKRLLLAGRRIEVVIEPDWPADIGFAVEDMDIGKYGRAYGHLTLTAAPARGHCLTTRITVRRKSN